jgi:hypothetical protein
MIVSGFNAGCEIDVLRQSSSDFQACRAKCRTAIQFRRRADYFGVARCCVPV